VTLVPILLCDLSGRQVDALAPSSLTPEFFPVVVLDFFQQSLLAQRIAHGNIAPLFHAPLCKTFVSDLNFRSFLTSTSQPPFSTGSHLAGRRFFLTVAGTGRHRGFNVPLSRRR